MTLSFNQELCEVRGCRITLKRCGSGPKLLYLHGANGAASVRPFMEELAKGFNVLVPEHPGFGGSDEPDWLDNIHDLAYFYLDFLEQLDLKEVLIVGASIGGWLALEIAVRDTSRIRALTAVGPLGIYVPGLKRGDLFLWSPEEKVRNLFFDQKIAEQMLAQPTTPEQIETEVKNQYTVARLAWEPRMFDPHLAKWLRRSEPEAGHERLAVPPDALCRPRPRGGGQVPALVGDAAQPPLRPEEGPRALQPLSRRAGVRRRARLRRRLRERAPPDLLRHDAFAHRHGL